MPPAREKGTTPMLLLFGGMFFLSGAVALIYEAAWHREFTLLFGSSAPATAAVLGAYFAGLGIGSFAGGKLAARFRAPLETYALLEIIIANGVLLSGPILNLYSKNYPELFARFGGDGSNFILVKALLCFAAIVLPTAAMGATFPVMAQMFEDRRERLGDLAGWLYMMNTAGAALGVLIFPFLLLKLGMRDTIRICITANFLLATTAFVVRKRMATRAAIEPAVHAPPRRKEKSLAHPRTLPVWAFFAFLSGFITFVLQVGWNRAFAQVHENSAFSFSLIVAIYIAAIAAGAQIARWMLRRKSNPALLMGRIWMGGGLLTLLAPFVFFNLTDGLRYSETAGAFNPRLVGPALLVIFFPIVLLAAGLPLILQEVANVSQRSTGDLIGRVLAVNIIGAVVGAIAGGFVFPGIFGMWRSIILAGAVAMFGGTFLAGRTVTARIALSGGVLILVGIIVARDLPRTRIESTRGERLIALREGAHGVAAVVERAGSRRLKLNNHYVLGGTAAVGDERLQAHLPLLLHPSAKKAVFLGYGTGITAGGATFHPATDAIALELVPEVASLASEFFWEANQAFGRPTGTRLIVEDARNFLRGSAERFDVIVGDLVVPWRQGEGALYTLEQFQFGRDRIATGGLYCAWLPMFQLSRENFQTILNTFLWVFPNCSVWRGDFSPKEPALALVGSITPVLDSEAVKQRLARMQTDPMNPQLQHAQAFWMHLIGIPERPSAGPVRLASLNSEDRPLIEFSWNHGERFVGRSLQAWENELRAASRTQLAERLNEEALAGWEAGRLMTEFTHLMSEGRQREAVEIQQQIRGKIGPAASATIFGP